MKSIKLLLVCCCSIALFACPENSGNENINFTNKSNKDIGFQLSENKILNIHQDTIFICNNVSDNFLYKDSTAILKSSIWVNGWEEELNTEAYLQILVLDGDKFSQYYAEPCDTIRKYVPILHCYRLTLEDLQRMNWTVVYPPEDE
jgi:hypothetical protein